MLITAFPVMLVVHPFDVKLAIMVYVPSVVLLPKFNAEPVPGITTPVLVPFK